MIAVDPFLFLLILLILAYGGTCNCEEEKDKKPQRPENPEFPSDWE